MDTKVYACFNKNDEIRSRSSSGGIYYLLADEILKNGGVVFAACYDGLSVRHKRIEDKQLLLDSLGSKYIPSELGDTFSTVKDELTDGKTVLFAGIPCQCAGLLSYIDSCFAERKNLITVDVICHGVPSRKAWAQYCVSLSRSGFNLTAVNMREKSSGWKNYSWRLSDSDGKSRIQKHRDNPYMKGFVSDIYIRPSCNNCRFKGVKRKTDITLGDYWGVQITQPEIDDDKGTSLVFLHTEVGQKLFDAVADSIVWISALTDQAIKHNPSIVSSSPATEKKKVFFRRLADGEDFCEIVEEIERKPVNERVKRKVKALIKKIVRNNT